ncbi:SDR family NAD(P)-dependent oxidoreductase [Phaeacidiphilus oryzae]|uniref:SDR family NAD(P)-dependent oxidoreductase n=1 Tax=Phaeacidiphilus oryzae TaxID=348818 RepID=UPI00056AD529|nr:SDR family NAD(P)-dependent oxidoreductase [Phaeacidiphilus oryzae]
MTRPVVLITGGASGIGRACAHRAAADGARVGVLDLDAEAARAVAAELPGEPGAHAGAGADVSDGARMAAAVDGLRDRVGPFTGLVASAGIAPRGGIDTVTDEQLRSAFAVNVGGVVHAVQAVLPDLRSARAGSIVALASLAAFRGGGLLGGTAYAASKGAVVSLIRALARELAADRIRVNAIAPGPTATPMLGAADESENRAFAETTLLGRAGEAEELAGTAAFLLGPDAGFITGQVLHANGGAHFG